MQPKSRTRRSPTILSVRCTSFPTIGAPFIPLFFPLKDSISRAACNGPRAVSTAIYFLLPLGHVRYGPLNVCYVLVFEAH